MSKSLRQDSVSSCVRVDAGQYTVGSDSIPQAGPSHKIQLNEFWIDAAAVSLAHLEVFIAGGGYFMNRWWSDSAQSGTAFLEQGSIDKRCSAISRFSKEIVKQLTPRPRFSHEVPAVGITWMEAAAVCRFFGARLPFEAEWEVAMQTDARHGAIEIGRAPAHSKFSRWGCKLCLGFLEEWTAGGFTTRHWRGGDSPEFAAIDEPHGICLRGSTQASLFADIAYRSSGNPHEPHGFRGFRRVWCEAPTPDQLSVDFRGGGE